MEKQLLKPEVILFSSDLVNIESPAIMQVSFFHRLVVVYSTKIRS